MAKELFGTDGIRGVPGTFPLDDATLYASGRALGAYLRGKTPSPHVLIGMDTRESGPHIALLLAAGLAQAGVTPAFAGIITTPGVACLVRRRKYHAGVVISASHNPYHDNGVKLFSGAGMKFPDATEEEMEADILRWRDGPVRDASFPLRADESFDAEYLSFLGSCVLPGAKLAGLRIVLDCANGAASLLGPALFSSLGAKVVAIHNSPDGKNINADCGSLHMESLQQRVVAERASLGVAFDGDADRALFVGPSGKIINGDGMLLAAARYLASKKKLKGHRVVATTMSNLGLERVLETEGIALARVPVGDRYVLEEMLRSGSVLGGEQSGHIIFLDDAPAGDGLLTAVKMASLVSLKGQKGGASSIEDLISGLKEYPQAIVNVAVRRKPPLESLPAVSRALAEANSALGSNGRIVLRYSGTEPLVRVMVEAEHLCDVKKWSESIASAVRSTIGA
jgi:phosphoglucosamine mutase